MEKNVLAAKLKKLLFGNDKFAAVTLEDGSAVNAEPAFELGATVTTGDEPVPLANGDYVAEDGTMFTVEGGIIVSFEVVGTEDEVGDEELLKAVQKIVEDTVKPIQAELAATKTELAKVVADQKAAAEAQRDMFTLVEKISEESPEPKKRAPKGTLLSKETSNAKFDTLVKKLKEMRKVA